MTAPASVGLRPGTYARIDKPHLKERHDKTVDRLTAQFDRQDDWRANAINRRVRHRCVSREIARLTPTARSL